MLRNSKPILVFATAYLPFIGGAELALSEIIKRLPEYQFDIITARLHYALPVFEDRGNIRIHRLGGFLAFVPFLNKLFLPILGFLKARSLYRIYEHKSLFALQASQAAGAAWLFKVAHPEIPFLINVQEGKSLEYQNIFIRFFRNVLLNKADRLSVISHYLGRVAEKGGIPAGRIVIIIPNGIDQRLFQRDPISKEKLGIKSDELVLISVSRLVPKNGLDILLRACSLLDRPYKLVLLGDGHQRDELVQLAKELNISDRVLFLGSIEPEDVSRYLAIADIFVRPSRSEGLGTAFLEAMAARVPIIAPLVGGIPDFLTDRETGLVCRPEDPASVAHSIRLLASDQALKNAMIAKAYDLVIREYTWDVVADKYRHLFKSLLA